jgi:hypothetical protein
MVNRQIVLAARPEGFPKESDFELVESEVPAPGPGEVLVHSQWLSLDPYMRGRMSTARSYAKPTEIGEPMTAQAVGEVVESHDPRFAPGDTVVGQLGWQDYAVARGGALRKVDPALAPPQTALHVLGGTGLTAYFGLFDVGRAKPGDTVVVSAASGAVGQVVGQLAKIAGCGPVVGLAGTPEKVADLTELYGYDVGIDYKRDDVNARLKEACPRGVDVYFDNVGGETLEAAIGAMRLRGRIVACGSISRYNATEALPGPRNMFMVVTKRLRMQGFIVSDHYDRFSAFLGEVGPLVRDGTIAYRETIVDGIERAPEAFIGMLEGANVGKMLVRVGPGPGEA